LERAILASMSLTQKSFVFAMTIIGLAVLEFLLSAYGVGLRYRALPLLTIAILALILLRQVQTMLAQVRIVSDAIDETARGNLDSDIPVEPNGEVATLANAVRTLRVRISEMGNLMYESVRVESLNLLGSILVHDMKNLSFRLQTLNTNIPTHYPDPAFRESLVQTLSDTTSQMNRMVKRFREQKEMVIVKLRTDLNQVVHGALIKGWRERARIEIQEEYGNLPTVWADAMLIESAILTIVENAIDAMPGRGLLAVRTGVADGYDKGVPYAIVEIADTGTGISGEFIQKDLFAPFVTTKPRGLGLGLYTCKQIIQMHGGEVRVRSELGRGTVFSIYLPITD
jgi:signal transduction histidine kinase